MPQGDGVVFTLSFGDILIFTEFTGIDNVILPDTFLSEVFVSSPH